MPEEVLADEDGSLLVRRLDCLDFLVKDNRRSIIHHLEGGCIQCQVLLTRHKRQIQDGQGKHHLGEVPRRLRQVTGMEGTLLVGCQVIPETINRHQVRILASDR